MRRPVIVPLALAASFLVLGSGLGWTQQVSDRLEIRSVTLNAGDGSVVISGNGFGSQPLVTIDGQPLDVLAGGGDMQLSVIAPVSVLSVPGTYRLTVSDPSRNVGDDFVLAVPAPWAAATTVDAQMAAAEAAVPAAAVSGAAVTSGTTSNGPGAGPLSVIEDTTSPYRTAIGASALANNTATGLGNTAAGHYTLYSNTTGGLNTGVGAWSLYSSTTGNYNTAAGYTSLWSNTSGSYNTAFGNMSLYQNTTGQANTAVGSESLITATNGTSNTAVGISSLRSTSGSYNTALGAYAGYYATSGTYNVFLGASTRGIASDTNTIRIGVPYDGAIGQNKAFIAGIRGASVTNAMPVVIDANGQLGTADNSGNFGIGTASPVARLQVEGGETRFKNGNGGYTHLNYANLSKNYIRGTTYFDSAPVYFTGGFVGIGTSSPQAPLHVQGGELRLGNGDGTYSHLNYYNTSTNYIRGATYFDNAPVFFRGGIVGIGTTATTYPLQLASGAHVTAGGVWTNASSRTLKQDIATLSLEQAVATVDGLAPVTYSYKASPGERHVGFIAEDVPDLVATSDRKSLSPMDIVAVLTRVVQAQQRDIEEMRARLAELEWQLAAATRQR